MQLHFRPKKHNKKSSKRVICSYIKFYSNGENKHGCKAEQARHFDI